MTEEKLQVVGDPSVELDGQVTKDGFTFKATVPVYPEVTLGQYKGLSAPKAEVKVTAADVNKRLEELAERNTRLVSVERPIETGDVAVIDYKGVDNGVPFDGGKAEGYELELGSNTFVPGFESQLVGISAGLLRKDFGKHPGLRFPGPFQGIGFLMLPEVILAYRAVHVELVHRRRKSKDLSVAPDDGASLGLYHTPDA